MRSVFRPIVLIALLSVGGFAHAQQLVTSGPGADYQPAVLKAADGSRIVIFERLDPSTTFGDLWITRSIDGGDTWSDPVAIIATSANERHPALVETSVSQFTLFHLEGQSAATSFRIHRATSSDGVAFAEQGAIDLGWATGGEINPQVVRHVDGTLTMTYQRLGSGAGVYIAESTDGGVTWDTQQTQIAASAQLPRVTFRESDGLYLATYQTGSSTVHLHVKTSTDVRDWSAPARDFAASGNNHDSLPVVMPDGAFVVFYIRAVAGVFDVAFRRSLDGIAWADPVAVTNTSDATDVEPHPLVGDSAARVELYWGRETPVDSFDYDIVREPAVVVNEVIFADSFES
ncbi:MAG: sialidase family protein [Rhodanobacteraceae bacterium]